MSDNNKLFESVHNYTKFKLVEMIIEKHLDRKLKSINAIEQLADDVLKTLAIAGLKYHTELKKEFKDEV